MAYFHCKIALQSISYVVKMFAVRCLQREVRRPGTQFCNRMPRDLTGAIPSFAVEVSVCSFSFPGFIGYAIYFTCWWLTNNHTLRKMAWPKLLFEDTWRYLSVIPEKVLAERERRQKGWRWVQLDGNRWYAPECDSIPQYPSNFFSKVTNLPEC